MIVRSFFFALLLFAGLAVGLGTFWFILLGPVMEPAWAAMGDAAGVVGPMLMGFAVLSGLGLYGALLWRVLRKTLAPKAAVAHLLTAGVLPIALAVGGLLALLSTVRFGF